MNTVHRFSQGCIRLPLLLLVFAALAGLPAWGLPPIGEADSYIVERNGTTNAGPPGVLANDNDPESDPMSAVEYLPPANGVLSLNADGSFTYTNQAALDLDAFTISSYSDQDVSGTATVEDSGATLRLTGNTWKKIQLPSALTVDTVLEFDLQVMVAGEVHAIGFDNDDQHAPDYLFQLAGSEAYGNADFRNYSGTAWRRYRIPVGLYFTGDMDFLCFVSDHDVTTPTADSRFRNIRVYRAKAAWDAFWYRAYDGAEYSEPTTATIDVQPLRLGGLIDFNAAAMSSYNGQYLSGSVAMEDGGATLFLRGNLWVKIALPYEITPNTVIEFDFQSYRQGEVQGVGFDDDDLMSGGRLFQVNGTQTFGHQAHHNYTGTGWTHYRIPVGASYTGNMLYLLFACDQDWVYPNAQCRFRNVRVYDAAVTVNFAASNITSYNSQDVAGTANVYSGGARLRLGGNVWKKIAFPYTVTPNTVIEFDFQSSSQGEIQGLALDGDNANDQRTLFQLYGTQTYGNQDFNDYSGTAWKHYTIPVGMYYTGNMLYVALVNDQDWVSPRANCWFGNIRVYESGINVDFDEWAMSAHDGQDLGGTETIENGGALLHLVGNTWQKLALPYTVTANTVLDFDYQTSTLGEIHGIQFDNDDNFEQDFVFQMYGTQIYGKQAYRELFGTGWKHFTIPVGAHYTGAMTYVSFLNDEDTTVPAVEGRFKSVRILEQRPLAGALDFDEHALTSYDNQDVAPLVFIEDGGATLHLTGNAWKKMALPYVVTPRTVLEFDFRSPVVGEAHGIGFDNNNRADTAHFFQLFGTDTFGIQDYHNYIGTDWVHYTIPVGQYYTGSMMYLVFMDDHDVALPVAESYFRNVTITETTLPL